MHWFNGIFVHFSDDHTRVRLRSKGGPNNDDVEKAEDYLNANFVDGFRQPRAYIATQGPIQSTFSAFWKMVWEQNTQVIVMITHLFENGKVRSKAKGHIARDAWSWLQPQMFNPLFWGKYSWLSIIRQVRLGVTSLIFHPLLFIAYLLKKIVSRIHILFFQKISPQVPTGRLIE